jgi:hypothetical protein
MPHGRVSSCVRDTLRWLGRSARRCSGLDCRGAGARWRARAVIGARRPSDRFATYMRVFLESSLRSTPATLLMRRWRLSFVTRVPSSPARPSSLRGDWCSRYLSRRTHLAFHGDHGVVLEAMRVGVYPAGRGRLRSCLYISGGRVRSAAVPRRLPEGEFRSLRRRPLTSAFERPSIALLRARGRFSTYERTRAGALYDRRYGALGIVRRQRFPRQGPMQSLGASAVPGPPLRVGRTPSSHVPS